MNASLEPLRAFPFISLTDVFLSKISSPNENARWSFHCVFTAEFFWRWVQCPRALTRSASSHLNTLDLNPFSAHFAFPSFKGVEQGHREGNCRIVVMTMEMHVFSAQKGAVGVGHSAFKFLPPSLPAGWWVWGWEFLPLFQFWLSPAWEERWVIVAAAPLTPITAPLYHQGAFLFWKLPSVRQWCTVKTNGRKRTIKQRKKDRE